MQCDVSQYGLGSVLLQDNIPEAYASRSMTSCKRNYSRLKKEILAILFARYKFRDYIYKTTVQVITDHKPLETIFRKSINESPRRLQRMLCSLPNYSLNIQWQPGKNLLIADHLNRARRQVEDEEINILENEVQKWMFSIILPYNKQDRRILRSWSTIYDFTNLQILH